MSFDPEMVRICFIGFMAPFLFTISVVWVRLHLMGYHSISPWHVLLYWFGVEGQVPLSERLAATINLGFLSVMTCLVLPLLGWLLERSTAAVEIEPPRRRLQLAMHAFLMAAPSNRQPVDTGGEESDAKQCAICLEPFYPGEACQVMPCCHVFHSACLDDRWLQEHHCCPVCRHDLQAPWQQDEDQLRHAQLVATIRRRRFVFFMSLFIALLTLWAFITWGVSRSIALIIARHMVDPEGPGDVPVPQQLPRQPSVVTQDDTRVIF